MKFFFSGLQDDQTVFILRSQDVTNYLIDRYHTYLCGLMPANAYVMLDNGAFADFRRDKTIIDPGDYYNWLRSNFNPTTFKAGLIAPDHFTNHEVTGQWWKDMRSHKWGNMQEWNMIPAWHYQAPTEYLKKYLKDAEHVAISGAAFALRGPHRIKDKQSDEAKQAKDLQKQTREQIIELCALYPNRLHVLGCNDLQTAYEIRNTAASIDTSAWLRGAKYHYAIFLNQKTNTLQQAPGMIFDDWADLTREQMMAKWANEIREILE